MKRVHVKVTHTFYLAYDVDDETPLEEVEEKAGSEAWQYDADESEVKVTKVERIAPGKSEAASVRKIPLHYFEICLSYSKSGREDVEHDFWMCIRGVRKPTKAEAEAFLRPLGDMEPEQSVIRVCEIDEAEARDSYDFESVDQWPIFGA